MVNFSVASITKIGLLLVLNFWTTGSTGAVFSFEEEFLQLRENYIQMKEIIKSLESKVTELQSQVQQQDSLLFDLLRKKNERTEGADSDFAPINQSAVAINGLPSSCGDLKMIGHIWNGIYSVMGSAMMESVYCDFSKPSSDAGFQTWIGYADVKSASVHFYVQRNSSFSDNRTPMTFDLARVNEGNAMDLASGLFTAPRTGIYFFSFTGHVQLSPSSTYLSVSLLLNGDRIGTTWVEVSSVDYQKSPSTLQSTLNLKSGDQVWVQIFVKSGGADFYDDNVQHLIHFTGFMLKEEIVASF